MLSFDFATSSIWSESFSFFTANAQLEFDCVVWLHDGDRGKFCCWTEKKIKCRKKFVERLFEVAGREGSEVIIFISLQSLELVISLLFFPRW